MPREGRAAPIVLAHLLLTAPLIAGCVPGAGPGQSGEVIGLDIRSGQGEIPADFPDSVPLVPGEVRNGGAVTNAGETTWSVTIRSEASIAESTAQVRDGFAAADYEETLATTSADGATLLYSGEHSVMVSVSAEGGQTEVTYVVGPAD